MTKSTPIPEKVITGDGSDFIMVETEISDTKPHIINLSSVDFTSSQIKVLDKSSKFCPTPTYSDLLELEVNIKEFLRKVELKTLFSSSSIPTSQCLVKEKGAFIPPECKDPFLAVVLTQMRNVAENLEKYPVEKTNDNLTWDERQALNELISNDDIVIKTADKGASWVIMDRDFYIGAMEDALLSSQYKK